MIGELNRRITLKAWASEQDDIGAPVKTLATSYNIWAKVEARNGHLYQGQDQTLWNYDYKVTFRYERSRPVSSNYTIDYDNKRLAINSISIDEEGQRFWYVARCTTTDQQVNSTDGEIQPDLLRNLGTYDYLGVGGEDNFSSGLINKTIIGAYKDGPNFRVRIQTTDILTPSSTIKEVIYVPATGIFKWSESFEFNEYALIQYI